MDDKAAQLCKRLGELKSARAPFEPHWSECYRFGSPERQQAFDGQEISGTRKNERAELLDSTASEAVLIMVANIISGTTPANAIWFKAVPDGVDDPAVLTEGEHWLETVAQFIFRNIHGANFDSEAFDFIVDYVVAGWSVMYQDIDRGKGGGYVFESWPIGQCYISSTRQDQKVDTIFRVFEMNAAAIVKEYGIDKVSEPVKRASEKSPDQKFKMLLAIHPRPDFKQPMDDRPLLPKNMPFASYHVEFDNKHIMREAGYNEFPCAVPRFRKIPGSIYGVGAMSTALPEAKQLNSMTRDYLRSLEMASIGMYAGVDDGILNPRTVRLGPGKIITVDKPDSLKRIDDARGVQVSQQGIESTQASVRRKLMADTMTPPYNQPMTTAETYMRVDMIRQQIGPLYGRAQAEFLVPILERSFGLAYRAGVLGKAPDDLQGRNLSFKFISPLARAQQLEDVAAIERLMQSVGSVLEVDPDALDNINTSAMIQVLSQRLGVPTSVMRTEDDLTAFREQKAQQQAQAQAQEQQAVMAQQMTGAVAKGVETQVASEMMQ